MKGRRSIMNEPTVAKSGAEGAITLIARANRYLRVRWYRCRGVDQRTMLPVRPRVDLRRVGGECAWVVPSAVLSAGQVCYCIGAGEDISFDLSLAREFKCEVHTFDPTPRAIQYVSAMLGEVPSNLMFHEWGVWTQDGNVRFYAPKNDQHVSHSIVNLQQTSHYFDAECKRVRTIMTELNHAVLTLLKLDIEGAEYEVIGSLLNDGIRPAVVAVEFDEIHSPQDAQADARIRKTAAQLIDAGYELVSVDGADYTFVRATAVPA